MGDRLTHINHFSMQPVTLQSGAQTIASWLQCRFLLSLSSFWGRCGTVNEYQLLCWWQKTLCDTLQVKKCKSMWIAKRLSSVNNMLKAL